LAAYFSSSHPIANCETNNSKGNSSSDDSSADSASDLQTSVHSGAVRLSKRRAFPQTIPAAYCNSQCFANGVANETSFPISYSWTVCSTIKQPFAQTVIKADCVPIGCANFYSYQATVSAPFIFSDCSSISKTNEVPYGRAVVSSYSLPNKAKKSGDVICILLYQTFR
jgi:hypothetical protein